MPRLDPSRLLAAIAEVHRQFLAHPSSPTLALSSALGSALSLTDAAIGFIARVHAHPSGPVLGAEAVQAVDPERHGSIVTWLRETLEASAEGRTIPRPLANLARAQAPLILDYEPRLPALDNLLAVPIPGAGANGSPIAVLGLANRSGGFTLALADELAPLLGACATVLAAAVEAEQRAASAAELARSERRFRSFMDASPCIAYVTDADRRLVWASRAFGDQFQVDPEAVVGRLEQELLPAGMAARTRVIDAQVREAEGFVELLEPVVDPSGVVHWWQGGKFPIEGVGGAALIGSLALDISDQVRATEALREREAALAEAQELARLGRWTWAPQTDSFRWDPPLERLCGRLEPDQGITVLLDIIHPDDLEPTRRALDRLIREGSSRLTLEHRVLVDGEVRELFVVARVRREGDEGPLVIAVVQDLSERRRLERSRHELGGKAQKYESLAILAGGVAEEFAELFAGIVGNVGIALDDLDLDSLAAACVQDIEAAAERGVALTEQLDALATRGRRTRQPVELSSLVTSVAERIHAAATDSVGVRLALAPDLPPLDGDPVQLRQLIMNLVANASEALADGPGELIVATGCDELSTRSAGPLVDSDELRRGRYVWLEVRDTGPGMDEATRRRIFEPYFSTRAPGRGLGLATVLGIVRAHRGAVTLESAPGSGTRVRVLLPPIR
jgi:PAS domain S-box-containing protein